MWKSITDNPNYYHFKDQRYKSKYICCSCRKIFKRKLLSDVSHADEDEKAPVCPQCGKSSAWIGPKFRAPDSTNLKEWDSLEVLLELGVFHFIGWANEPVTIPKSERQLKTLLLNIRENLRTSIGHWKAADYDPINSKQIRHLSELIQRIDKYL